MVDFHGTMLPVQYDGQTISESAKHTRQHVSIFDVSHMLQTKIKGRDSESFIESLTCADLVGMPDNTGALSVFTNEKGGIEDDLIVSKTNAGYLYMVTNAGCKEKDLHRLNTHAAEWRKAGKEVEVESLEGRGLVAIQGPGMVKLLKDEVSFDLSQLYFMCTTEGSVFGVDNCRVTRCGYTGEDGVEISVDPSRAEELVDRLLSSKHADVRMAGLGARDALRLEAGLCLYGNDIREDTTPVEAALAFVVAKRRRQTLGFPGAEKIVEQLEKKNYAKRRVGLISQGGRSPRAHLPLVDPVNKAAVGFVTSGCPSPCLGKNIAMAYVDTPDSTTGKALNIDFGTGRTERVEVAKLPFVQSNYYVKPKEKKS